VFSAFNRAIKMTPITLDLWARTMAEVENSRLLMKGSIGDRPQLQKKVLAALEVRGVDPQRVSFLPGGDRPSHLAAYRHVDIQLDTVPEQGGITTLESFWCGVPVVTWRFDDRILTRSGATICTTLGLPELIADSPEAYVSIARNLANDRNLLKQLRASLRSRMETSPLLDLQGYTQSLQAAFREMWRRYCAGMPPQNFDVATLPSH
jgi:predicted O-linked N-acetylglucosamine transferase (SPINDLY family)